MKRPVLAVALATLAQGCGGGGTATDAAGDAGAGDGAATDAGGEPGLDDPGVCREAGDAGTCPSLRATDLALDGVHLGDGWTKPRRLAPPVSTPGWEDGAFLGADGVLWFGYTRADALAPGAIDPAAPVRCHQPGDGWAIYRALPGCDGLWRVEPLPAPVNAPAGQSLAPALAADGTALFLTVAAPGGGHRIALAVAADGVSFGAPAVQAFGAPASASDCADDNPAPTPDALALVFESNRDDADATSCKGPRRLWRVSRGTGGWQPPELFAPPDCGFTQPNLSADGRTLHFTVPPASGACALAGAPGIWRVALDGRPGPMGAATRVAWTEPKGDAGEIALVGDGAVDPGGQHLTFTFFRQETATHADVGLGLAERP